MKTIVLLFSGGADSALLFLWAQQTKSLLHLVMFDYGQKHAAELEVGRKWLAKQGWVDTDRTVDLKPIFQGISAPLLNDSEPYTGVHEKYVPARNLVFISAAAAIAESIGADEIWYGADYSDRENLFPDCTQEWVRKANELLRMSLSRPISLRAPLLGWTKGMVRERLEWLDVNVDKDLFSGYQSVSAPIPTIPRV